MFNRKAKRERAEQAERALRAIESLEASNRSHAERVEAKRAEQTRSGAAITLLEWLSRRLHRTEDEPIRTSINRLIEHANNSITSAFESGIDGMDPREHELDYLHQIRPLTDGGIRQEFLWGLACVMYRSPEKLVGLLLVYGIGCLCVLAALAVSWR